MKLIKNSAFISNIRQRRKVNHLIFLLSFDGEFEDGKSSEHIIENIFIPTIKKMQNNFTPRHAVAYFPATQIFDSYLSANKRSQEVS